MRRVAQEQGNGCGVAALAMVLGRSYDAVRAEIDGLDGTGHDGDWDAHGISCVVLDRILIRHGFYLQRVYIAWHSRRLDDQEDPADPVRWELRPGAWPPAPWAPCHIAQVTQPSGHAHFVAMDREGQVADPMRPGRYQLSDWPEVSNVTGLVKP